MTEETEHPKPIGRPSLFNDELAATICEEIAAGSKLRDICEADNMPNPATVYRWLAKNETFCEQYARAQSDRSHAMAEEVLEIADESGFDAEIIDGRAVVNNDAIQRARLRVDTRKWLMSKMTPMKYGDVIKQVHQGPDGKPLNLSPTIIFTGAPAGSSPPEAVDSTPKPSE